MIVRVSWHCMVSINNVVIDDLKIMMNENENNCDDGSDDNTKNIIVGVVFTNVGPA